MKANLAGLKAYADAKSLADAAGADMAKIRDRLDVALDAAATLLDGHYTACSDALKNYRASLAAWKDAALPSAAAVITAIKATQEELEKNITSIESNQGEQTYAKGKRKIDALIEKARAMNLVLRERRSALISAAVTGKIDVTKRIEGAA